MRVLVTGHLGYIGAVLTPMLLEEGFEVIGLDTELYRGCTFEAGGTMVDVPGIDRDVRNVEVSDLKGIDAVVHLAALSNDPLGNLNADLTHDINHRATVRLAELSRDAGIERFIFSSSCSNYGAGMEDVLTEHSALNPLTPYGVSKVNAEKEIRPLATDDFSPVSLRNATAYGMSPRLRFDLVVNNLTAWAVTTGEVRLQSDGTAWRPLVHVRDICRAFIAVLRADRDAIHDEVFNVGGTDENYQIRDVATIVSEVVPNCAVGFAEGAEADTRNYRVSCEHIHQKLGFELEWNVRRGAEEAYDAYRRADLTHEVFTGPRYHRIARIREQLESGALDESLHYRAAAT